MTVNDFSDRFDVLLNSYNMEANFGKPAPIVNIVLDEYEKSVFLTQAQNEYVVALYSGNVSESKFFESTEELRRSLDTLIEEVSLTHLYDVLRSKDSKVMSGVKKDSKIFGLPNNLLYILLEQVIFDDENLECLNDGRRVDVIPTRHDEYNRIKENPFRGTGKKRVLRLDCGSVSAKTTPNDTSITTFKRAVELISDYEISSYIVRYLRKPSPIVLTKLPQMLHIDGNSLVTSCELPEVMHEPILNRAVELAIASKQLGFPASKNSE